MDKSSSRIIKSASAFLAVLIIVVAIVLINQKLQTDERREAVLKETINYNEAYDERLQRFSSYVDEQFALRCMEVEKRDSDYAKCVDEQYEVAHISMWNIDALDESTYPSLFGYSIIYPHYEFKTPMELREYLDRIVSSKSDLNHVYINIDPYILENNYKDAVFYDENPQPFEEYIHNEILQLFNDYPKVSFDLFLPARPVSYWASLPVEEYNEIMDRWYVFLMYLHWCPNVVVRYLGDQEWLVANDYNYESPERFTDEVLRTAYLYLYAYEEYEVNAPELKQKKGAIDKYIRKEKNGDYNVCDLSGKKVVFMGDSLFDFVKLDSACISGVVKRMTGAECYNFAISGTCASAIDNYGFTRIANATAMKSVLDLESRYQREAKRFLADYKEDDDVVFVILYGMNDYFSNVPIVEDDIEETPADTEDSGEDDGTVKIVFTADDTFNNSIRYGIESLKKAYPQALIIVLSPYVIGTNKGGKEPYTEGGRTLPEYIKAIDEICKREQVEYYDLYSEGPINKDNLVEFLSDGIHTKESGVFLLGEDIAEVIYGKVSDSK